MEPLLYRDLVSWYRLIDPPADHRDEAHAYRAAFEAAVSTRPETLLELGAGAGHNAFHLKHRFRCTLSDVAEPMLALSRALNPECEHCEGDMRSMRLGRQFDVVLVHDAVMYMTTEGDLTAAVRTAFEHTRPGGAAIFAPDCYRETFEDETDLVSNDEGARSVRGLIWSWDPDPNDHTFITEYALLLRDGDTMRSAHDRHVEGVFSHVVWERTLEAAGFRAELIARPIDDANNIDHVYLCRR